MPSRIRCSTRSKACSRSAKLARRRRSSPQWRRSFAGSWKPRTRAGASRKARTTPARRAWTWGVSILIPERDAPAMLADALESVLTALAAVREPHQVIVVVNGAPLATYEPLRRRFPAVEWEHRPAPLGFSAAIAAGLRR